ncbi:unnamed protein product, partial [marine sediment metagenome]
YKNFDSDLFSQQHVSDKIDVTTEGVELLGKSGFNFEDIISDLSVYNDHDLYEVTFKFDRYDANQDQSILFLLNNEDVNLYVDDADLYIKGYENTVSFIYDFSIQKWQVYLNDRASPEKIFVDTSPTDICPRIETIYDTTSEGIIVTSINSQFYKRVRDDTDFSNYKNLVSSYKIGGYTDILELELEDLLFTPENTFAQISSDINIIYSFNDEMDIDKNILSFGDLEISPTFINTDYSDPFAGYNDYYETGFMPYSSNSAIIRYLDDNGDFIYVTEVSSGDYRRDYDLNYGNSIFEGEDYLATNMPDVSHNAPVYSFPDDKNNGWENNPSDYITYSEDFWGDW